MGMDARKDPTGTEADEVLLTQARYLNRKVPYLSTESSDTVVAALENATFAPNLGAAPKVGK
jgi:hypothetical protein